MKITTAAMADLHGYLPSPLDFKDVDLVLIAGDVCPYYERDMKKNALRQTAWCNKYLRSWCKEVSQKSCIVAIGGNHDHAFEFDPKLPTTLKWHYLKDQMYRFKTINIWGTPWVNRYTHYPLHWSFLADNKKQEKKAFEQIPDNTNILLSHETPKNGRFGSEILSQRIQQIKPDLVICGHVHDLRGIYESNGTPVWNVGLTKGKSDQGYQLNAYNPFTFRLNLKD